MRPIEPEKTSRRLKWKRSLAVFLALGILSATVGPFPSDASERTARSADAKGSLSLSKAFLRDLTYYRWLSNKNKLGVGDRLFLLSLLKKKYASEPAAAAYLGREAGRVGGPGTSIPEGSVKRNRSAIHRLSKRKGMDAGARQYLLKLLETKYAAALPAREINSSQLAASVPSTEDSNLKESDSRSAEAKAEKIKAAREKADKKAAAKKEAAEAKAAKKAAAKKEAAEAKAAKKAAAENKAAEKKSKKREATEAKAAGKSAAEAAAVEAQAAPAAAAKPPEEVFQGDLDYYHTFSDEQKLDPKSRLYLLGVLQKKYASSPACLKSIQNEIDRLGPDAAREKKSASAQIANAAEVHPEAEQVTAAVPPPAPAPEMKPSEPPAASEPPKKTGLATLDDSPSEISSKSINRRVSLNLVGMPLIHILRALSLQTGANFIISKEIQGKKFSAFVQRITLRESLQALLETQGLGYEQIGDSDTFVIKELSKTKVRLVTRVFRLKYTQLAEPSAAAPAESNFSFIGSGGGGGGAAAAGGGASEGSSIAVVVKSMLSDHGKLQVHPPTNSLIVSDLPENIPRIEQLITGLDTLTPQVLIETVIVEANADTSRQIGLDYGGADGTMATLTGPSLAMSAVRLGSRPTATDLTQGSVTGPSGNAGGNPMTGTFFGMLSFQQFTAVLKAVETSGNGQYLAKPKILTLNNKMAEIEVTADTAIGQKAALSGGGAGGIVATTAERQKTGVSLRVTPQINEGDLITLMIEPSVSLPQSSQFFPAQFVDAQTRSIRTSVRVKDGETLLIGGLLSNQTTDTNRSVPFLGRIPLIGALFRSSNKVTSRRDLMIFITPRVVRT